MKHLLERHQGSLALVLGNGINQYHTNSQANSWIQLLETLASKYEFTLSRSSQAVSFARLIQGLSLTEFYDLLEMKSPKDKRSFKLQSEFCKLVQHWRPSQQHFSITQWAKANNAPILTTNFDSTLATASASRLKQLRNLTHGFTAHYPWSSYYGTKDISSPMDGFGVWHINGMPDYPNSIRLGLSHYMGSVERARSWLYAGNEEVLFGGKNQHNWAGSNTWLHVIFNKPLLIFGLGLSANEVFLRWLLIERARYFKEFPDRYKNAWYVCKKYELRKGQKFFLEGVGINLVEKENYDEIYQSRIWEVPKN